MPARRVRRARAGPPVWLWGVVIVGIMAIIGVIMSYVMTADAGRQMRSDLAAQQAAEDRAVTTPRRQPTPTASQPRSTPARQDIQPTPTRQQVPRMAQPRAPADPIVYIAPDGGERYHSTASCRALSRTHQIVQMRRSQAVAAGYTPCALCH